jgi:hypothetical protein
MPIILSDRATDLGSIRLASNDIVIDVVDNNETVVARDRYEFERQAREFSNRTIVDWNAFVFFVPPDKKRDREWDLDARARFHIHMIAQLDLARRTLDIDKLLPKSTFDREGIPLLNLADHPTGEWEGLVAHMAERTRIAVDRFRWLYVEPYLITGR